MSSNLKQLRERGEHGKMRGMELAATRRADRVAKGEIAMLRALLASSGGTATIDDATADLAKQFTDGGKWRGTVCRKLATAGLIRRVGVVLSDRPSRHRGYVTLWRLVDSYQAQIALSQLVASMVPGASVASAPGAHACGSPDTSPINKTPAPGATGTGEKQQAFPTFQNEKGFCNG